MSLSLSNYKEWLPFAIIIVGLALALISPFLKYGNQSRQRARQLLNAFGASLQAHDLEHWKEVYLGTREAALAPAGHFINRSGKPVPLDTMWAAVSDDHTAIQRMAECLEKACAKMLTEEVDIKMMWYEIGQLMEAMHGWLEDIPGAEQDLTFLEEQYPSIKLIFEKHSHRFKKWPYHVFAQR